jgi:hypothetical protein
METLQTTGGQKLTERQAEVARQFDSTPADLWPAGQPTNPVTVAVEQVVDLVNDGARQVAELVTNLAR